MGSATCALPSCQSSAFSKVASSPWTKTLVENVTVQAGTAYIVSAGNPLGALTGVATGVATTVGQWITATGVDALAEQTGNADSLPARLLGSVAKEAVQLGGTGVNFLAHYALAPTNFGVKAAQSFGAYFASKGAGLLADKAQDAVGVPKDSVARPVVHGIVCGATAMAAADEIGRHLQTPSHPVTRQRQARQAEQTFPCQDTINGEVRVVASRTEERYFRVDNSNCQPNIIDGALHGYYASKSVRPVTCDDTGAGIRVRGAPVFGPEQVSPRPCESRPKITPPPVEPALPVVHCNKTTNPDKTLPLGSNGFYRVTDNSCEPSLADSPELVPLYYRTNPVLCSDEKAGIEVLSIANGRGNSQSSDACLPREASPIVLTVPTEPPTTTEPTTPAPTTVTTQAPTTLPTTLPTETITETALEVPTAPLPTEARPTGVEMTDLTTTDSTTPKPNISVEVGAGIGVASAAVAIPVAGVGAVIGTKILKHQQAKAKANLPQPTPTELESQQNPIREPMLQFESQSNHSSNDSIEREVTQDAATKTSNEVETQLNENYELSPLSELNVISESKKVSKLETDVEPNTVKEVYNVNQPKEETDLKAVRISGDSFEM